MLVRSSSGQVFALTILGYQFPYLTDTPYDSNWLQVQARAHMAGFTWVASDPCLLTYELQELINWLQALADGQQVDDSIGFTEPELSFQHSATALHVFLSYNLCPDSAPVEGNSAELVFPLAEIDLHAAVASLQAQLDSYPQRAEQ